MGLLEMFYFRDKITKANRLGCGGFRCVYISSCQRK